MSWHICPKCKDTSLQYKGYCAKCMKEYRKLIKEKKPQKKMICKDCGSQEVRSVSQRRKEKAQKSIENLPPKGSLKKTKQDANNILAINIAMKSVADKKKKEKPKLKEHVEIPLSSEYDTFI